MTLQARSLLLAIALLLMPGWLASQEPAARAEGEGRVLLLEIEGGTGVAIGGPGGATPGGDDGGV
ncbi:MAG: hypothetical protein M3414_02215 [Pseudomonadota bacterium]|nr:hypothetical protein [Pseudomonadota bacterium]